MAKARAIVKRRKAVRNIRKITKTMQMIATAKFQKSLKRAVGTKPYTMKVRELVRELAESVGNVEHPLLRKPRAEGTPRSNRIAVVVLTSNRGLAGAYNGSVLRRAMQFIREQESAGGASASAGGASATNQAIDLYVGGKKGITFFNFQKKAIKQKLDIADPPRNADSDRLISQLMHEFTTGVIDAVYVVYMNFISTSTQRPDVMELMPLAGVKEAADAIAHQVAEKEAQMKAGMLDAKRTGTDVALEAYKYDTETIYDFSPEPRELLDELLPLTIKTAFFQAHLDAATSEHVARMVAMKSATDAADKMAKSLSMQYNRARQSQITTELAEIMGGVEAMKA